MSRFVANCCSLIVYSVCLVGVTLSLIPLTSSAAETYTKKIPLSQVDGVELSAEASMSVSFGDEHYIKAMGSKESLANLSALVKGSTLVIKMKGKNFLFNTKPSGLHFEVQLGTIKRLKLAGGGKVSVAYFESPQFTLGASGRHDLTFEDIHAQKLTMNMSGSTVITAQSLKSSSTSIGMSGSCTMDVKSVHAKDVIVDMSGSSTLKVSAIGEAGQVNADISGMSQFYAPFLRADRVDLDVSGSAKIKVHAVDSLSADLSGSADIEYAGSPKVRLDSSGSSSLKNTAFTF